MAVVLLVAVLHARISRMIDSKITGQFLMTEGVSGNTARVMHICQEV
jgi:hypothetical protein